VRSVAIDDCWLQQTDLTRRASAMIMVGEIDMSMRHITLAVSMVALLAACGKKAAPAEPIVAPQQQTQAQPSTPTGPTVNTGNVAASTLTPGSLEELISVAGSDRVLFAYDSSDIDGTAQEILRKEAGWLQKNGGVRITIEGHCDERGTREYNLALGDRRAESVKSYLVSLGVGAGRINTVSYGKERPEQVGSDDTSYAANRRGVTVLSGGPVG
jgi:peptidoglycan-associated lipoprotein